MNSNAHIMFISSYTFMFRSILTVLCNSFFDWFLLCMSCSKFAITHPFSIYYFIAVATFFLNKFHSVQCECETKKSLPIKLSVYRVFVFLVGVRRHFSPSTKTTLSTTERMIASIELSRAHVLKAMVEIYWIEICNSINYLRISCINGNITAW